MEKISIIVPVYKGNRYIAKLIRMAEENWKTARQLQEIEMELILVNDFPSEKIDMADRKIENVSCHVLENTQNRGIHYSRVQGFLHSSGDYILFLDQDDEISPLYLKEQMKALHGYDAVICNGKNRSRLIYQNREESEKAVNADGYRKGRNRIVSPGQVLLRRDAVPKEWVENIIVYNGADDFFLWMLLFSKGRKIGIHDGVLYWHMISDSNTSENRGDMDKSVLEMADKMKHLGYLTCEEEMRIKENRVSYRQKEEAAKQHQKVRSYGDILELWMVLREKNILVDNFLKKLGIRKIAIYGGGILGKHLLHELLNSEIQVTCVLDRNRNIDVGSVRCLVPGTEMEPVDAIIVTPYLEYAEIRDSLEKSYPCDIISIETVLLNADCELLA